MEELELSEKRGKRLKKPISPPSTIFRRSLTLALVLGSGCAAERGGDPPGRIAHVEARLDRLESDVRRLSTALDKALGIEEAPRVEGIEIGQSPTLGPDDAPVTIVGFSDFECPFCAGAVATLERVLIAYPAEVRRVFKHYPMPVHKQAVLAHKAALAAAAQGKFWEMHHRIYASQDKLDLDSLRAHAQDLGLDIDKFDAFVASDAGLKAIQQDREQARKLGVLGVPAFFINGRFVAGAQPFEVFQRVIDEELASPPHSR